MKTNILNYTENSYIYRGKNHNHDEKTNNTANGFDGTPKYRVFAEFGAGEQGLILYGLRFRF